YFQEMDLMCLCSILLHTLSNSLGIIFNVLLMFLVLKKTPQQLKTYSILIFNFALCDLFACSAELLVQQRLICGGKQLYLVFHGPCRLVGSEFCFVIHSFALHCYAHTLWSLLFSFSYRFYVLKRTPPSNGVVIAILVVIYLPSLLQFISFCFANEKETELRELIKENFGYDVRSESVGGSRNILSWISLPAVLHMTLPVTPIYIAIHVIRKLTISLLDMGLVMSENNRRIHSQLLQALTVQACLPVFFLLAVTVYAIEQLEIIRHPLLDYSCFILIGFIPMLSPLTSFLFIRPYNIWIKETLLRRPKVFSTIKV
uniref:G_PROTEIN_RECEP_F1_2 domain-containing protein n=1 Tax=Haemonchus contortus TaxID=6289 RepID=A0A7I4YT38_HAECO